MPAESDEPLRKVTLNLFAADVEWFERQFGHGWTGKIREVVRAHKNMIKARTFNEMMDAGDEC